MNPTPLRTPAAGALLALCFLLPGLAHAQDERVERLLEKVRLLEERVHELEGESATARAGVLEDHVNALTANLAAAPGDYHASWKNGSRFTTEDKAFELRIGGRIHNDWIFGTQDEDYQDAFGAYEDGVIFRRARLYVQGRLYEHFFFKAQYDFAGGDADFRDVFLGVDDTPIGTVTVGQFKQPFGLDELTGANYDTFMEQAPASVFVPSREVGLMVNGNLLADDRMTYAVSVFRDVNDFGDSEEPEDGKYNLAARLTWAPIHDDEGRTLLHVGAGLVWRNPDGHEYRIRSRPDVGFGPRLADTMSFDADDVVVANFELATVLGPFSAQGEVFYTEIDGNETCPTFWGFYVQASYFLTGEHRPYKKGNAVFDRVKVNDNFMNGEGGSGAWELAARYSYLDLNDDGIEGGELSTITLGVNWYLNPHTRVMLNYIYADACEFGPKAAADEAQAHIFGVRFQIDF